jgi:hypothetical protein
VLLTGGESEDHYDKEQDPKDRTQQKEHVSHQLIKLKALPTNLRLKE